MREATRTPGRTPFLPFDDTTGPYGGAQGVGTNGQDALRRRVQSLEQERETLLAEVLHLQRVAQTGLMTSGLAHDLANQLTVAMGEAEHALGRGGEVAMRDGLVAAIDRSRHMHDVVEAFLSFARRRDHRVGAFGVAALLEDVARIVEPVARGQCVEWIATCTTQQHILADRQLVCQAIVNLALNGIRAASHGGRRVVFAAAGEQGVVSLSVRDTGPGISEDARRHLFEPRAAADGGGGGFGLYVVRQVVERSGGRLRVDTSPAGTRIDIDLPAAAA